MNRSTLGASAPYGRTSMDIVRWYSRRRRSYRYGLLGAVSAGNPKRREVLTTDGEIATVKRWEVVR